MSVVPPLVVVGSDSQYSSSSSSPVVSSVPLSVCARSLYSFWILSSSLCIPSHASSVPARFDLSASFSRSSAATRSPSAAPASLLRPPPAP